MNETNNTTSMTTIRSYDYLGTPVPIQGCNYIHISLSIYMCVSVAISLHHFLCNSSCAIQALNSSWLTQICTIQAVQFNTQSWAIHAVQFKAVLLITTHKTVQFKLTDSNLWWDRCCGPIMMETLLLRHASAEYSISAKPEYSMNFNPQHIRCISKLRLYNES